MKIIKKGNPNGKVYRVTCRHCGCVYEFERKEARFMSDQRDGDALTIDCPECNTTAWVVP